MASPTLPQQAPDAERRAHRLERARGAYRYRSRRDNQLHPISVAGTWSGWREFYDWRWLARMAPGYAAAWARHALMRLRFGLQRATFRFDKLKAYDQLFPGSAPPFAGLSASDEAFAYWRIAGPNPLALACMRDLGQLRRRIPLDVARVEARLRRRLPQLSLDAEADAGRLFVADFLLLQNALRGGSMRTRDSRWRDKYLPASIGVFLEAPGFYEDPRATLVPLAIQIDQMQPTTEPNPVYYPDGDVWAWRLAKLYFETADVSHHVACGHVFRTHLVVGPFCLATPRQLSRDHPVHVLLRPHTRFTLKTNGAAYDYFVDRRDTYHEFYAGTLEETRQIAIQSYLDKSFRQLDLETELADRGVDAAPVHYPYRDDARLWLPPIRDFVGDYVGAFYASDADVAGDGELQAWARELMDPECGAVREMLPDERLDTRHKLVELLAQVIFTAGPGHASQHFSSNHYYRYAPAFPASAYVPPPWREDRAHRARLCNTLPPLAHASNQVRYNTFTNLHYDRFGDYRHHRLGRTPEARGPIERLQAALRGVESEIRTRQAQRLLPYEFLLPSQVPNSTNI
jgi:arachidonate 15-lipoxygenase